VIAEHLLLSRERSFLDQAGINSVKTEELAGRLDRIFRDKEFHIRKGTFITTAEIISKRDMTELLPAGVVNPVLEMETAAVARASDEGKIPLIAIRAISDGPEEELKFAIKEFTDREMNLRLWKVLVTMAKKTMDTAAIAATGEEFAVGGR